MTESTREHYNELAGAVVLGTHPILPRPEWGQDCAYLAHVLDTQSAELVKLRHDVAEWMCRECRYVYPGPPQPGVKCVICPRCNGDTMPLSSLKVIEADELLHKVYAALDTRNLLKAIPSEGDAWPNTTELDELREEVGRYLYPKA